MWRQERGRCPQIDDQNASREIGEDIEYQIVDANKDSHVASLRKRVHEALRTKVDDEVAVRRSNKSILHIIPRGYGWRMSSSSALTVVYRLCLMLFEMAIMRRSSSYCPKVITLQVADYLSP